MPKFYHLDRITWGADKGTYRYRSHWLDCYFRVAKDPELGGCILTKWDAQVADAEPMETRRFATFTEADRWIGQQEQPLINESRKREQAERDARAAEAKAKAEREKAERLSVNSHLDSEFIVRTKITKTEAVKLAERLLHWAIDSYDREPMDSRCIDFTLFYTDATRGGGWREEADDTRMSVGVGWASSGDDISPRIHDSYVGKREQPEPVADDENIGVAV